MDLIKFIRPTKLTFVGRKLETNHAHTYRFTPATDLGWKAGQHGMLELRLKNGRVTRRMFSVSSAPSEEAVHITTYWLQEKASAFKKALHSLQPGDTAKLRGPVGPLHVRDSAADNIFIAGGIGITPFRSIIREAFANKEDLHATLLYTSKTNDFIFKKELDTYAKKLPNLTIRYLAKTDMIADDTLASVAGTHPTFYISGAPKMIRSLKKRIRQTHNEAKIYTDPFFGY